MPNFSHWDLVRRDIFRSAIDFNNLSFIATKNNNINVSHIYLGSRSSCTLPFQVFLALPPFTSLHWISFSSFRRYPYVIRVLPRTPIYLSLVFVTATMFDLGYSASSSWFSILFEPNRLLNENENSWPKKEWRWYDVSILFLLSTRHEAYAQTTVWHKQNFKHYLCWLYYGNFRRLHSVGTAYVIAATHPMCNTSGTSNIQIWNNNWTSIFQKYFCFEWELSRSFL